MTYGVELNADQAGCILQAAGIAPDVVIDPAGLEFTHGGVTYWIFPGPAVYKPGPEEMETLELPDRSRGLIAIIAATVVILWFQSAKK